MRNGGGGREPLAAAQALHDFGVSLAVVKQGPKGVLAHDGKTATEVPPVPVNVLNGIGAGDAFGGALCHGLLAGGLPAWPGGGGPARVIVGAAAGMLRQRTGLGTPEAGSFVSRDLGSCDAFQQREGGRDDAEGRQDPACGEEVVRGAGRK